MCIARHKLTERNSGKFSQLRILTLFMEKIHAQTEMGKITATYPGARRALFAKYHIGGCSSCAYKDTESLLAVCERNEIDVDEAISYVLSCHESDQAMLIEPTELKQKLDAGEEVLVLDTRTREEHEAVKIAGSKLMTQELQQEIFAKHDPESLIVLYDHLGKSSLDTCAWFVGHSMKNTKALNGGIDAWSQQVDSSVARYRLEMD